MLKRNKTIGALCLTIQSTGPLGTGVVLAARLAQRPVTSNVSPYIGMFRMEELEKWMLTTIPGVLFVGAVGSILGVAILKVASIAATSWFPRTRKWFIFRKNMELIPHGWLLGSLSSENNIPVLIAYFAFRLMRFMAWLFVCGLGFVSFVSMSAATEGQSMTPASALVMMFFFLGFYLAIQEIRIVRIFYDSEVMPKLRELRSELRLATSNTTKKSSRDNA